MIKQQRFLKRRFSLEKYIRWDEKCNNDPSTISIVVIFCLCLYLPLTVIATWTQQHEHSNKNTVTWTQQHGHSNMSTATWTQQHEHRGKREPFIYRSADKSLARPGRKQANKYFCQNGVNFLRRLALQKKKNLMTARVSRLLKSRASLTCLRACFLPGRVKDLSATPYSTSITYPFLALHFSL